MRKTTQENSMTMWLVKGCRRCRQPRICCCDNIMTWSGLSWTSPLHAMWDRGCERHWHIHAAYCHNNDDM